MSVDTYLQGKKTSGYKRVNHEDITILVAPMLSRFAHEIQLITRKKLLGQRLVAVVHHNPSESCRIV